MDKLFENAPCVFFSFTDQGILLSVNNTLCQKSGFSREELVTQDVRKLFTIATRMFYETHFFPLLKLQGYAEEISINLQTKDKTQIPLLVSAERKQVDNSTVNIACGITVPRRQQFENELIAAKKNAETALEQNSLLLQAKAQLSENLQKLEEQMYVVNKQNEELKQLNHVVTHELQEPLRKIFLFSNMIEQNKDLLKEEAIRNKLKSSLDLMQSIVSGLQQYVWLSGKAITIENIDLNKIIHSIKDQLCEENPELSIELMAAKLPEITGDLKQMRFLFYELLKNAIKFRKHEKNVCLKISSKISEENAFKHLVNNYKFTKHLTIDVADKGIGFGNKNRQEAFDLFRKLHEHKGQGLGLTLCKKIVENHWGELTIGNEDSFGTHILILLPFNQVSKNE